MTLLEMEASFMKLLNKKECFDNQNGKYIMEGGQAKLYDTNDGFVTKVFKTQDQSNFSMFLSEVEFLINCPKCLFPEIRWIGYFSYSMKNYQNSNLGDFLKANPKLNITKKAIIAIGICYALRYLHQNRIIHRDIKLSNVLIDENFYPILADLGIAKAIQTTLTSHTHLVGHGVGPNKPPSYRLDMENYGFIIEAIFSEKNEKNIKDIILGQCNHPENYQAYIVLEKLKEIFVLTEVNAYIIYIDTKLLEKEKIPLSLNPTPAYDFFLTDYHDFPSIDSPILKKIWDNYDKNIKTSFSEKEIVEMKTSAILGNLSSLYDWVFLLIHFEEYKGALNLLLVSEKSLDCIGLRYIALLQEDKADRKKYFNKAAAEGDMVSKLIIMSSAGNYLDPKIFEEYKYLPNYFTKRFFGKKIY